MAWPKFTIYVSIRIFIGCLKLCIHIPPPPEYTWPTQNFVRNKLHSTFFMNSQKAITIRETKTINKYQTMRITWFLFCSYQAACILQYIFTTSFIPGKLARIPTPNSSLRFGRQTHGICSSIPVGSLPANMDVPEVVATILAGSLATPWKIFLVEWTQLMSCFMSHQAVIACPVLTGTTCCTWNVQPDTWVTLKGVYRYTATTVVLQLLYWILLQNVERYATGAWN